MGKRGRVKAIRVQFHTAITASANKFQLQIQTEQLSPHEIISSMVTILFQQAPKQWSENTCLNKTEHHYQYLQL